MASQFDLKQDDLEKLEKFAKTAPGQFRKSSASVLNEMAVNSRNQMIKQIKTVYTIRRPQFLNTAIRYQLANKSAPIENQHSIAGSIKKKNFSGWAEPQTGESSRITVFTEAGRKGNFSNTAQKQAKAGQNPTSPNDVKLSGAGEHRMFIYLQQIQRDPTRRRKSFYLPKQYKRMKRGIYRFKGGRVGTYRSGTRVYKKVLIGARIEKLSTPDRKFRPRSFRWLDLSVNNVVTENNVRKWWVDSIDRAILRITK